MVSMAADPGTTPTEDTSGTGSVEFETVDNVIPTCEKSFTQKEIPLNNASIALCSDFDKHAPCNSATPTEADLKACYDYQVKTHPAFFTPEKLKDAQFNDTFTDEQVNEFRSSCPIIVAASNQSSLIIESCTSAVETCTLNQESEECKTKKDDASKKLDEMFAIVFSAMIADEQAQASTTDTTADPTPADTTN